MAFVIPTPYYHNLLKKLTAEQGWNYSPGPFMKITGRDAGGEEWLLKHANLEDYTYSWQTACPVHGQSALIASRAGTMAFFLFSKMRRYRIGPQRFQRRYVTAATDDALLKRLLSQALMDMLLDWPRPTLSRRNLKVTLKHDRLSIITHVNYDEANIRRIVDLGTALKQTIAITGSS